MLPQNDSAEAEFERARHDMVEHQLIGRGIRDERVLAAMRKVPRHAFVPEGLDVAAYSDQPLPIGGGQTISAPYVVALMLELLELKGDETVLEVGTGSGYQAALLAELARRVYTIERVPELAARARENLQSLGYGDVSVVVGDGTQGLAFCGPFDGIVVAAASPQIPPPLVEQLTDGGRLVLPLGGRNTQTLVVIRRRGDRVEQREVCGVVFVPLIGDHGWKQ
ncbi:MAG: protein-L-isoaspartate(D-aspartate) O-methyltransferase [Armatimonadota bacterium]